MIQRNAIRSWPLLPEVEVHSASRRGRARPRREGTWWQNICHMLSTTKAAHRLISSMFQLARESSHSDLLCIINTEWFWCPILPIGYGIQKLAFWIKDKQKLCPPQPTWDLVYLSIHRFIEGWQDRLNVHRPRSGSTPPQRLWFLPLPKSCYTNLPPFAIGREQAG